MHKRVSAYWFFFCLPRPLPLRLSRQAAPICLFMVLSLQQFMTRLLWKSKENFPMRVLEKPLDEDANDDDDDDVDAECR